MNYYTAIPLTSLLPEIMVALSALITILIAAFCPKHIKAAGIFVISALVAVLCVIYQYDTSLGHPNYAMGKWEVIFKLLTTLASIIVIYGLLVYPFERYSIEFMVLVLLGLVGSFVIISARDFLLLFMGMELQALVGYVLAAFNRGEVKSSEAGLKYFALGGVVSCLGLLGISFLYGFTGNIDYYLVAEAITVKNDYALAVAGALVLLSVLFKLSAAPFHSWAPDIYEGAPTISVIVFASSVKLAMLAALINLLSIPFLALDFSQKMLEYCAIFSMVIGALGGVAQTNVKRLMGYSAIMNIGFVLAAISINRDILAIFYLVIYVISVSAFLLIVKMIQKEDSDINMHDLATLPKASQLGALCAVVFIFSMAGIPPFSGFFAKFYIFTEAISQDKYLLISVAAVTSVISAYYYLKMIRYMYFENATNNLTLHTSRRFVLPLLVVLAVVIICAGFQVSL